MSTTPGPAVHFTVGGDGVARVTLDQPNSKANVLNRAVWSELAVARRLPSWLNAIRQMPSMWPLSVRTAAEAAGFTLESTTSLGPSANWTAVSGAPNPLTGAGNLPAAISGNASVFYRLKK